MQHAKLITETHHTIDFQFNPADLTITKAASWQASAAKGVNAPKLSFQGGQSGTLTVQMLLDATTTGKPVTEQTDVLLKLLQIDPAVPGTDSQHQSARPPWVEFHWGRLHAPFRAVVERLTIKYTYFSASGIPLRARCDLALKQYDDTAVQERQNPTSSTPSPHTLHRLLPGETLDRVSARHYGDATRWRVLADANGIDDPLHLTAGTQLVVPQLPVSRRGR